MAADPALREKTRILFFAEAVTLAHVGRPFALANALPGAEFEVHFAHDPRYRALLGECDVQQHEIRSMSPRRFAEALARGAPIYGEQTLRDYVEQDLALIDRLKPRVVIGDFRLSLSVSCRLAKVPYVALGNAYWSPGVQMKYTVPELPITRILGPELAQVAFNFVRPLAFALHARPLNRVRKYYGLASLGPDVRRVYTDADYVLFADIPAWYGVNTVPAGQSFLGPVQWEPVVAAPAWLAALPQQKPVIYVTMGSSGNPSLLPAICSALAKLPVTGVVSTAGAPVPRDLPANVYAASYLQGSTIIQKAALVICNGGSPTTQQALSAGVPVIGLAGNLDQYLNMSVLESIGAGVLLRSGAAGVGRIVTAVESSLQDGQLLAAARKSSEQMQQFDASAICCGVLRRLAGASG